MNESRISQLKKFIEESPEDPFVKYALALEYVKIENDEAGSLFDELLADHSDYLPAYYHAAEYYAEKDEIEKARTAYEKGIELSKQQKDIKAQAELQNAYQNFLFEIDDL
jgi:Tfp pilus assembly protein PilF